MGYPVLLVALLVGFGDAGKLTYEASQEASGDIACPNGISKCSVGHTCCKLGENWGCCPFTRATCCSDNVHCCPQGYSCDGLKQECVQAVNNATVPWAKKQQAPDKSSATAPPENLICPDGTSCPGGSACCRHYSGSFTCCNYPNNVCCADGGHCCPRCSICDARAFKCIPTFATAEWKTVSPTKSSAAIANGDASPDNEQD